MKIFKHLNERLNLLLIVCVLIACGGGASDAEAGGKVKGYCSEVLQGFQQKDFLGALSGEWGVFLNQQWKVESGKISVTNYAEPVSFPKATVEWVDDYPVLLNIPEPHGKIREAVKVQRAECKTVESPYGDGGTNVSVILYADIPEEFYQLQRELSSPFVESCFVFQFGTNSWNGCK